MVSPPADEPRPAAGSRSALWQALVGIAVSAGFLYWALKDISPGDVIGQIRAADLLLFILSVAVVTLCFPARAFRWRVLLDESSGARQPFRPVWLATAIGYMANNILPARAGEVVRAYAARRLIGLPVSTALSTVAVERIFDGVVVVLLLAVGIAAPGFPRNVAVGGVKITLLALGAGAVFTGALVFLALVARWPDFWLGVIDRTTRAVLPERAAAWASKVSRNLFGGLTVLRSPAAFARVLGWTLVIWLINALSFEFAFQAFHLEAMLPITAALVLQGIAALGVAVPSSPGYIGVFQAACIAALGIYGIPKDSAVGFSIALHAAWFVPITVLGLWALLRAGLTLGELRRGPA